MASEYWTGIQMTRQTLTNLVSDDSRFRASGYSDPHCKPSYQISSIRSCLYFFRLNWNWNCFSAEQNFLKWQPCSGHLLCCVNQPTVLLIFFNKLGSCSVPYFNLFLYFIVDGLALALNSLGLFTYIVPQDLYYGDYLFCFCFSLFLFLKYSDLVWLKLGRGPST